MQLAEDNAEIIDGIANWTLESACAQIAAWRILVRVLRARYQIPLERVYAHNWIDFKDARYCEGCALATLARQWGE